MSGSSAESADLAPVATALGARAVAGAPLGTRTTYRVGGRAALLVEAHGPADLEACHQALAAAGAPVPVVVLGRGSNLLVADDGFPGLAIVLGGRYQDVAMDVDRARLEAGGAAALPVVARQSARAGLSGFEWAVGVPGSIGGAVRMNAGGHGSDMASVLEQVTVYDLASGAWGTWEPADLELGYRTSALGSAHVVGAATIALAAARRADAEARIAEIVRWRRQNQPGGSNAGSVFTNPEGASAGALVEAAGLKGVRVGSAQVSDKHANFIQCDEDGAADDVRALIEHVRRVVAERIGVELRTEVHMLGFVGDPVPTVHAREGSRA